MKDSLSLYPHNQVVYNDVVNKLDSGCNSILIVQGMGVGKSFVFMALANQYFADKRILYVVPKSTIERNLRKYNAFEDIDHHVDFSTYASFNSDDRILDALDEYDVFIIDEAHHLGSEVFGRNLQLLLDLVKDDKSKVFIGMTATPVRDTDNVDVSEFFDEKVNGLSTIEAIQQGLMPRVEYLVCSTDISKEEKKKFRQILDLPDSETLLESIISENTKKKWLVYFSSLKDAEEGMSTVRNLFPNHRLIKITSDTNNSQDEIDNIKEGENVVIVSVDMLLEGIHLPDMQGVLLFRRVHSLTVFTQIFGRITSIGATEVPLFIDCTDTAQRMLGKLMGGHGPSEKPAQQTGTRDILVTSLKNQKYFDIAELLEEIRANTQPVYVGGVKFPNIKAACAFHEVRYKTVLNHMKIFDYSLEEAIRSAKESTRKLTINGVEHENRLAACNALNLPYNVVNKQIEKGYTAEQVIAAMLANRDNSPLGSDPIPLFEGQAFEFRGKLYKSLTACCNSFNITSNLVSGRASRHQCTLQEALEYYLEAGVKKRARETTVFGKTYPSMSACLNDLGFSKEYGAAVREYAKKHEMTWEAAMEELVQKRGKAIVIDGVSYRTRNEAIRKNDLKPGRVNTLMKTGLSFEEAVLEAKKTPKATAFIFRNKQYNSFKEACNEYGFKSESVSSYASKKSISKEAALEYFINKSSGFQFRGETFASAKECCVHYGLNPSVIGHHVSRRKGSTWQDIIQLALDGELPTNSVKISINNMEFNSAADACRYFGLKYGTLSARRKKSGMSWNDVIAKAINLT